MKIYDSVYENLWDACGLEKTSPCVISVVGAGGKSHLIRHFSKVLNQKHISHFIMTTTHMWPMDAGEYGNQVGSVNEEGKLEPPDEFVLREIFELGAPVLIEADGSKGLPCKAPGEWEPVIRKETTHVFAVLGAQALGQKVASVCHRPEKVQSVLDCSEDHVLQAEDFVKIFLDRNGLKKGVSENQKYFVLLNQIDDEEDFKRIHSIKYTILNGNVENMFFTQLKDDEAF